MNINLELYKIFLSVAKNQNITKASEELRISQPAISKQIKNLEESLGGVLFIRTKRGVTLTKEGEELYKYIEKGLEYITNAENKFTDLINLEIGTIRIGASTTIAKEFLMPYLEEYHKLYPHIKIEIHTSLWSNLIPKLRNGLIDMIILNVSTNTFDSDIEITKIKTIKDCFITSRKYIDKIEKPISLKKLSEYPLIIQSKKSNARTTIDNFCKKHNITLTPSMELSSYTLVNEFTKRGFGIGYATKDYIKEDLKNKTLYEVKIKEKIPHRHIGIALSKNNIPNFATKKMLELITKNQL